MIDVLMKVFKDNSLFVFEFYVDNLFDKEYFIDVGNIGGGLGIFIFVRGMFWIVGVCLYYDF